MSVQMQGDHERARSLLEEGLQRYRNLNILGGTAAPLYFLAWLTWDQGDAPYAAALAGEALAASHVTRGAIWVGHALELVAALAADHGLMEQGARLLGRVAALREAIGDVEGVFERGYSARVIEAFQGRLSDEPIAAQVAVGRTLSLEEAVAEATALATRLATSGSTRAS
jgi:hypothetical protein